MIRCVIHNLWIKIRNEKESESMSLKFLIIEVGNLLAKFDYLNVVMSNTQLCMFNAYS